MSKVLEGITKALIVESEDEDGPTPKRNQDGEPFFDRATVMVLAHTCCEFRRPFQNFPNSTVSTEKKKNNLVPRQRKVIEAPKFQHLLRWPYLTDTPLHGAATKGFLFVASVVSESLSKPESGVLTHQYQNFMVPKFHTTPVTTLQSLCLTSPWWLCSLQARLRAIQLDPGTYCKEPEGDPQEFRDWVSTFHLDTKKGDISELLVAHADVRALYTQLVSELKKSTEGIPPEEEVFFFVYQRQQIARAQKKKQKKLEMLGSIVSRLAHYDACVNLSTLCNRGIFWQGTC